MKLDLTNQSWQRRDTPVLAADTAGQAWSGVILYTPHVIKHAGRYRMWYIGGAGDSRSGDSTLGYAESDDGVTFRPHPDNPILTGDDIGWGRNVQTPHVMFDADEGLYRMWFITTTHWQRNDRGKVIAAEMPLAYATSADGLNWRVHSEPLYEAGRRPTVIKHAPDRYVMWMNSRPSPDDHFQQKYKAIYRFVSNDGLTWQRDDTPAIVPTGRIKSCVYPFVMTVDDQYVMWYGGHVPDGMFEIFSARSDDGLTWRTDHQHAVLPAAGGDRFDGRYTSTPCVIDDGDRYLMYYSGRSWSDDYRAGDGTIKRDGSGVYASIGVAVMPKPSSQ